MSQTNLPLTDVIMTRATYAEMNSREAYEFLLTCISKEWLELTGSSPTAYDAGVSGEKIIVVRWQRSDPDVPSELDVSCQVEDGDVLGEGTRTRPVTLVLKKQVNSVTNVIISHSSFI